MPDHQESRSEVAPKSRATTEKLIVLSTFNNSQDAQLFRVELAQNGIDAHIANELSTSLFGATIAGPSSAFWIEVLVLESDVEKALEIKTRLFDSQEDEEMQIPDWDCSCGETVDAGFSLCWNCNTGYEAPEG